MRARQPAAEHRARLRPGRPHTRLLAGLATAVIALAFACPAAGDQAGALTSARSRTLVAGVTLSWYPGTAMGGLPRGLQLVTVTWPLGDPRYRVRTVATGGGIAADGFLSRRRLSVWGAAQPASLVAAITPDFGSYTPRRSIPSGLEIGARTIVHLPGSTVPPSVGYTREGRLVIGSVRAKPIGFQLPGGATATVDAVNGLPLTPSGVGAYTRAGAAVSVPSGYRAVVLHGSPFPTAYRAPQGVSAFAGKPQSYALHLSGQPAQYLTVAIGGTAADARLVTVPTGGTVLLMRTGGAAAAGFASLLATTSPHVRVNATDAAWADVTDVMGGKPILVRNGVVASGRPATMSDYQWSAPTSRIALGETADGQGIIAVLNGGNGSSAGVDAPAFAQTLVRLGVTNAIGFDAGPVPEIYSPRFRNGSCAGQTGWCYQSTTSEWAPSLTSALSFTP